MEIEQKLTYATIVALISIIASSLTTYLIALFNNKKTEEKALRDSLTQINHLNIQYPFLENATFINKYSKKVNLNENDMRYESYCIIVFNYLERLATFCDFSFQKMENYVHVPELILPHSFWWKNLLNTEFRQCGYNKKFIMLVDQIIKKEIR